MTSATTEEYSAGNNDEEGERVALTPLSIEAADDHVVVHDETATPTRAQAVFAITRRASTTRRCCLLLLLALCTTISFIVTHDLHTSIPRLFGIKSSALSIEPVCLSTELSHDEHTVSVDQMDLNRVATAFSKRLSSYAIQSTGFEWDERDAKTSKWRPQGVTTLHASHHHYHHQQQQPFEEESKSSDASLQHGERYVLTSWYERKEDGYAGRGARISFVNVTDMQQTNSYSYRHVLLVDSNFCTLPGIHVGGIEYQRELLHVVDSRKGMQSVIEFDVHNDLYELPQEMRDEMFGYRYVLVASASFHVPTKPSFISYDIDSDQFIVGTYSRCGNKVGIHVDSKNCYSQPNNKLVWFDKDNVSLDSPMPCGHYFSEMQGATSARVGKNTVIWVSSSYGGVGSSHLHMITTNILDSSACPDVDLSSSNSVATHRFLPGLEDLHIEQTGNGRYLWSLTEFGTRMVFATAINDLLVP
jgi:hypothetical protein